MSRGFSLKGLWVGKLKGAGSHFINHEIANRNVLDWQVGYGVVTFGAKDLPWAMGYVRDQREHHAHGRTVERLERIDQPQKQPGQGPWQEEAR